MNSLKPETLLRALGLVLLLTAVVILSVHGRSWWPEMKSLMDSGGPRSIGIFMAVFVGLTTLCFPVSVLGFTAGAIFGPWLGLAVLYPSGLISGTVMFAAGRWLLRGFVSSLVSRNARLMAIEKVAGQRALRLNILTRLSPFNYGVASYALASGSSSFRAYLGGLLVILPSMAAQVWMGALASKGGALMDGAEDGGGLRMILLVAGVLFFLILTWQVGRMVRQALEDVDK